MMIYEFTPYHDNTIALVLLKLTAVKFSDFEKRAFSYNLI